MSRKFKLFAVLLILFTLFLTSCTNNQEAKVVTIGGKADTEAYVLANLAKILLEEDGFQVETELGVKSVLARQALENEQVDLYYDYTGTAYTVYYNQSDQEIMTDPQKVYQWVKDADQEQGIIWLEKLGYNNTYTIMVREEDAEKWDIESISDLAGNDDDIRLVFGTDTEFYNRPDGLQALMDEYGLEFKEERKMSAGIIYKALRDGELDAGMGYSTDGRISAFGFINLEDDRNFFPVYNPAPLVREDVLEEYPEIETVLDKLDGRLTTDEIQSLNAEVDVDHKEPADVSQKWLEEEGLI
ncbi:MAG: glycine betaine ABC transporter substrate-binding protein [Halanaerobiales bacterium]